MCTEEETLTSKPSLEITATNDSKTPSETQKDLRSRLSHERLELLQRTLDVRHRIGKVSTNVAELVHEMREQGA
jgi:hypothetical protein